MQIHRSLRILIESLIAVSAFAQAEDAKTPPAPTEEEIVLERADLQVTIEADGTIDAAARKKIKIVPEESAAFPFVIAEIATNGQPVDSGSVVIRFDASMIERTIRETQDAIDAAKTKLDAGRKELDTLKTTNKLKIERMGLDLQQSTADRSSFDKYGEEQMLAGRALQVRRQEAYLEDRLEELAQLEKMYKDASLATETKEIVLDRSRRDVEMQKTQLDLTKKSDHQLREYEFPAKKQQVHVAVDQKTQDLDLFKISSGLAELQKSEELKGLERAIRNGQEKIVRLENDLAQMVVKAPFAGVFNSKGLEAGDKVGPNTAIAELLDVSHLDVKFSLALRDLVSVHTGDKLEVTLPDLPDAKYDGKIEELAGFATEGLDKGAPRFGAKARLSDEKNLRPGCKAKIEIRGEKLKKVISLPRKAIVQEETKSFCWIKVKDKPLEKREIVTGAGNHDRIVIVRGLNEGEIVVVKEAKAK